MLLVILGAGASFDSIQERHLQDATWRPPLTKDLFRREFRGILAQLPAAQAAAEAILHAGARAEDDPQAQAGLLEAQLAEMLRIAPTDRTKFRDLEGVRLYLQRVMQHCSETWLLSNGGITNHAWLVGEIESWRAREHRRRVVYITFNYDTILDQALAGRFGWDPRERSDLDGYIAEQNFALLKLHGSYDWMQRTSLPARNDQWVDAAHDLVHFAGQYETSEEYRLVARGAQGGPRPDRYSAFIEDYTDVDSLGQRRLWTPALALPMTGKTSFVCPSSHRDVLDSAVPLISGILAVGWRGAEDHFLDRLVSVRSNVPFFLVSPEAPETTARLHNKVPASLFPITETFSGFREKELLADVLKEVLPEVSTSAPRSPAT